MDIRKLIGCFIIVFLHSAGAKAVENDTLPSKGLVINIYQQEAGYYLNHLDSFVINTYFKKIVEGSAIKWPLDSQIYFPPANKDSLYESRLKELDKKSPFDLSYNPYIGAFIDLYVYKKRPLTENCLALSEYYFPVFEEILDKYDLPQEFKYLAVVESALNVRAKSRAGAAGLWQFMYRTGKQYGLEANSYVDERYELYAATDAACRFFSDLYKVYGNWELVIAAYNCGPGNVNKAIRRSGGKRTYWEIRPFLPRETRGYVPAFIAVNYAMNYSKEHGLRYVFPDSLNLLTDTIRMKGPLDLTKLSEYFCADKEQIFYLNPSFNRGVLPDDGKMYSVKLPIGLMNAYLEYNKGFDSYCQSSVNSTPVSPVVNYTPSAPPKGQANTHVVRNGEVLGLIAERYGCSVSQIKDWNNLSTSRIYEGQKLKVYGDVKNESKTTAKAEHKEINVNTADYHYYTIKPGDTLWDIAKLYDGVSVTDLKQWNQGLNHNKLKPGDKIIVSRKT